MLKLPNHARKKIRSLQSTQRKKLSLRKAADKCGSRKRAGLHATPDSHQEIANCPTSWTKHGPALMRGLTLHRYLFVFSFYTKVFTGEGHGKESQGPWQDQAS